jgi:hypothetical protein
MSISNITNLPAPQPPTTINDLEQIIASALEGLRPAPLSENITAAFPYLLPEGLRLRVQLEEDGRKKRSTAAASNWNPETGEIVIYFERQEPESSLSVVATQPTPLANSDDDLLAKRRESFAKMERERKAGLREDPWKSSPDPAKRRAANRDAMLAVLAEPKVSDSEIQQLCIALAEAEKAGKAFIALKWFRDNELITHGYAWAESLAYRQAVLAKAFEVGAILTASIPNPKAPQHPTTTIRLNRESKYAQAVAPRFQPIQLRGEGPTASEILLRDRERF